MACRRRRARAVCHRLAAARSKWRVRRRDARRVPAALCKCAARFARSAGSMRAASRWPERVCVWTEADRGRMQTYSVETVKEQSQYMQGQHVHAPSAGALHQRRERGEHCLPVLVNRRRLCCIARAWLRRVAPETEYVFKLPRICIHVSVCQSTKRA